MKHPQSLLLALLFTALATTSASAQDASAETEVIPPPPPAAAQPVQPEAEEGRARNLFFGEVLGAGLFYSVNYERLVHEDLGVRVGFGSLSLSGTTSAGEDVDAHFITVPLTLSYLGIGSTRHIFELGGGVTFAGVTAAVSDGVVTRNSGGVGAFGTAFAGYRYHPREPGGFHFRGGMMAVMARGIGVDSDPDSFGALPWPYLGFGGGF